MASSPTTAKMKCRRAAGTGTTLTKEAEEPLVEWVQGMRNDGVPLTTHMLRVMTLEAAIDLGFNDVEFRAGWHWMDGFKAAPWAVPSCTYPHWPADTEDGLAVSGKVSARIRKIVEEENIDVVYNVDQTAVNYEYLPTKRLNKSGEYTVLVRCGGKTKYRMTEMLLADTTGAKHPLFLRLRKDGQCRSVSLPTTPGFASLWTSPGTGH
ncbi:hypothetical protein H257_01579 [Aphanomyces astaci]|uniref:HTH CENPB-type domain-containing protein n=1 Tax=Aphanomyces astaci TaxID=112090 RepID=W4H8P0_APHAT|nr:hypothetical protein H257_01579 [Aphanomyces astaci]ETV88287.1 hypothetical protein H257_01579 [Aphanomyces astaci]|eukprot:XP_009823150.1 hypothetical protein H257_01579 [Aphanomyces astaci]